MENFEFWNPTKIIFGKGVLKRLGQDVKTYGNRCLLVTGMSSAKKTGAYDQVTRQLQEANITVFELSGIQSNPVLSKVYEGIQLGKKEGISFIVALGGGSVMDTAKAVAAGMKINKDIWLVFEGKAEVTDALPVICIPTLAASGSEMNGFMVITNNQTGYKLAAGSPYLYPKISFLSPELTFSVPRDYTAYGGVDAVCHLLEPYFNGPDPFTPVQDELAEGLIRTIMTETKECIDKPQDYEHRAALMWAATLALNGLTRAGVGDHPFPVHLIEHSISAIYQIPHGAGLAALLPGWMKWKISNGEPKKVAQLGIKCLGCQTKEADEKVALNAIGAFENWLSEIGCPKNLADLKISRDEHEKIAHNALLQSRIWGIDDIYNIEAIMKILSFCQ